MDSTIHPRLIAQGLYGAALRRAARVGQPRLEASRLDRARGAYFIGACLAVKSDPRSGSYLREAIRLDPFHLRAWARLSLALLDRASERVRRR